MNPEQLWETTMNPDNRMLKQVNIENAAEADYIFSMLMGEDVGPRREFINLSHILHRSVPAGQGKPAVGTSLFLHLAKSPDKSSVKRRTSSLGMSGQIGDTPSYTPRPMLHYPFINEPGHIYSGHGRQYCSYLPGRMGNA